MTRLTQQVKVIESPPLNGFFGDGYVVVSNAYFLESGRTWTAEVIKAHVFGDKESAIASAGHWSYWGACEAEVWKVQRGSDRPSPPHLEQNT